MDALYDMADEAEDQDFDILEFFDGIRLIRYDTPKDFSLKFLNDVRRECPDMVSRSGSGQIGRISMRRRLR